MSQLALVTNAVIAFDEPIYADGIKQIIKDWKGMPQIKFAQNLAEIHHQLKNEPTELLIIDQYFPGFSTPVDIKNFAAKFNQVLIIVFYKSTEKSTIHSISDANVSGLVSRKADKQNAAHAIRTVLGNKKYNDTSQFLNSFPKIKTTDDSVHHPDIDFASREHDLLSCLFRELKPSAIYKDMGILAGTYQQYRSQINKKIKPLGYTSIEHYISVQKQKIGWIP